MTQTKLDQRTIALAGVVQAITLIKELAKTGKMDEEAFQASIYSIFQTHAEDIPAIYGSLSGIRLGLEQLVRGFELSGKSFRTSQIRYLLSLIHLEKKISRSPDMLALLANRIQQTRKQVDYFYLTHPTVIANLGDIYLSTISTFQFRIIIWGNQRLLNTPENMNKIRALLLSGIRSVVLWRQLGGSRLQLLFSRKKIKLAAENLLKE